MSGPMGLIFPQVGADTGIWGTVLDTLLGLVENHDHSPGKGVQVPTAGIGIDADLTFASFAGTNLKAIAFTEVAASSMTSYSDALFVSSADHNLYFRNASGVNVQITEGNTIDVSIVGGIGGDYSTVGALLSYDDATHRYLFQQEGTPRPWAGIAGGNLDIYQQAASIGNFVRQQSPSALAASYTMTWLAALPASAMGLSIDNTGQIAAGASFAMQSNANITLSGTGAYKHGVKRVSRYLSLQGSSNIQAGGLSNSSGVAGVSLNNNSIVYYELPPLPQHCRIVNVAVYFATATDRDDCTCKLYKTSGSDPMGTAFADTGASFPTSGVAQSKAVSVDLFAVEGQTYHVQISNSISTPTVCSIAVDYDVP